MEPNSIATKKDLLELWDKFVKFFEERIQSTSEPQQSTQPVYLRSSDVRKLLHISDNKLRDMRNNHQMPFTRIENTYFYSQDEILKILKDNQRGGTPKLNKGQS